jgi:hypothetical protein
MAVALGWREGAGGDSKVMEAMGSFRWWGGSIADVCTCCDGPEKRHEAKASGREAVHDFFPASPGS